MSSTNQSRASQAPATSGRPGATAENLAVVHGTLSNEPRIRDLPSGSVIATLEVTILTAPRESVPVSLFDPPAAVAKLGRGDDVVIVGRVRRRFFRAGGATQSRTEIVADRVVRASARRSVRTALANAAARLTELTDSLS